MTARDVTSAVRRHPIRATAGAAARARRALVLLVVLVTAGALAECAPAALALPASVGAPARSADSCDPCVFVFVERYGSGRVMSDETDNEGLRLDCGTRCNADFVTYNAERITLRPVSGAFMGWDGCPSQIGSTCTVPLDGQVWCIRAYFDSQTAPLAAGACLPPGTPPPPPPPPTPPPVTGVCSNEGSYTSGPDVIRGTPQNEILCGGGGSDVLYGGGGEDLLRGGPGGDRLYGQDGRDKLYGDQTAPGKPRGTPGNDRLFGGTGNDRLFGEGAADTLVGAAGVDRFSGGPGGDMLSARDRRREIVDGNRGRDRGRVDRNDVARSLERRL